MRASPSRPWFVTSEWARRGRLDGSRLDAETRDKLRRRAMAPTWKLDADGRRVVEPKDKIKTRLGRSPDGMDAMNLAYYHAGGVGQSVTTTTTRTHPAAGMFGGQG
ncbi:MAG TPA: hypothetical protein VKE40_11210 [Gemmataceae bacterium]|nr:hypothetical protein [Gemmataceae bacterium]